MKHTASRKGARRASDIPADILQALSRGEIASATLTEALALDQRLLARTVFPGLPAPALQAIDMACQQGILKRMSAIGAILLDEFGAEGIAACAAHGSDTVRGWACFMIGARQALDIPARLAAIRALADDAHFAVREWAWMAVRAQLASELETAISALVPWTQEPSGNLRRFASEALRPRGVWCAHISALKQQPQPALPILTPLNADPSGYVQDSVANWLNDAGKDQPEWVKDLCREWQQTSNSAATRRICQRALRNL
ncbi:DNA alkylation repair protein [Lysobacteraceae bacterium NML95-0200]|nr:DNA alkylation repair protein [Xanthomonadaceae bacterium NML95-0200]